MSERGELRPHAKDPRAEILSLLPHRDPFLFVDEIVARNLAADGASLTAAWTIPADSAFYRGHYPGGPVTPGVILCEHAFQCGALLVALLIAGFRAEDGVPVLTRIGEARFRRMVEPGARVETVVLVSDRLGPAWYLKATVRSSGATCVKLSFALSATAALARAVPKGPQ